MSNIYQNGKIYKIVSLIENDNNVYVGSTCNTFGKRLSQHKYKGKDEPDRRIYKYVNENGGWDNFKMVLIEEFPCENKLQLEMKEREWIDKLKSSLNYIIPTRTKKESYAVYSENNKEKILHKKKLYYENNKANIHEKSKVKYTCTVCNCELTVGNKCHHEQTKKHIKNLSEAS